MAVESGRVATIRLLLQHEEAIGGAKRSVDIPNKHGVAPLHYAVSDQKKEVARMLLDVRAAIDAQTYFGYTPLHLAVHKRNKEMVRMLLDAGAGVDVQNDLGYTPLCHAADSNYEEMVRMLLDAGADVNLEGKRDTPLHCAVRCRDITNVRALLDYGADPSAWNSELFDMKRETPLHSAVKRGNSEVVSLLLERGSDVHAKDHKGRTSLHLAVKDLEGEVALAVINLLLKHGAAISAESGEHETPLHIAAEGGPVDILLRLLMCVKQPLDVNIQRADGWSVLHLAISERAERNVVSELLKLGASVTAANVDGETPLHIAAERGTEKTMAELLHAVKLTSTLNRQRHSDKSTALHLAIKAQSAAKVTLLLEHGADFSILSRNGSSALKTALSSENEAIRKLGRDLEEIHRQSWSSAVDSGYCLAPHAV